MCGIVGFIGKKQAAPILLESLSKLEYRGYDSAGLCVREGEKNAIVVKAKGKLKNLSEKVDGGNALKGTVGIGHTRWATHGAPSEVNAHPHVSGTCSNSGSGEVISDVVGVHNGIIENYVELKDKLTKKGYVFYSQTDTEVAVKLVDYYYKKYDRDMNHAIAKAMIRIRGSYALELMFKDHPNQIWVARKDSPMIIGIADGESYIASDVPAILKYSRDVYYIDNYEFACVEEGKVTFYNLDGESVEKQTKHIDWDASSAEKGGYPHFMLKEIHEEPTAVENTLNSVLDGDYISFEKIGLTDEEIKRFSSITIVACGSAWHTGVVAQYVIEKVAKVPVRTELASEFRYRNPLLSKDQLLVVVSQSGETADTLAALRLAKDNGVKTLAIVNVVGSSIAREADYVFYTLAGPEISVATTKAYSAQLIAMYAIALKFAHVREGLDEKDLVADLRKLPAQIKEILEKEEDIQRFAAAHANRESIFYIGRGVDYAICLEGSLKLKEISYIHCEAYAAGELKHGTISLVDPETLILGVMTQSDVLEKTMSNMVECKARGATLAGVTTVGNYKLEESLSETIYVPKTNELFAASLAVIPLQLIGYYISCAKGYDVDKPRNLAKSVTVE